MLETAVPVEARVPTNYIEKYPIPAGELDLILSRHVRGNSKSAAHTVLLLHGASASSLCFQIPERNNLIGLLHEEEADVWTLDWRGSNLVSPKYSGRPSRFTLDKAAKLDIPSAIEHIRKRKPEADKLAVFGHCMGAGVLSMAIGAGCVKPDDVSHVVLSTLGLFYQVPWDGWIKAEDYTLERIRCEDPDVAAIDADCERKPWPALMEEVYQCWPATFMPPKGNEMFRRLSFMFGQPYEPELVAQDIHNDHELKRQFGEIPLLLYMHCAQNVRRGYAAPFDCTDNSPAPDATYLNAENFQGIELTLITGSRNQLWHPDAIHRMYDWLHRSPGPVSCSRVIFPKYAHQDLLWGKKAHSEVHPTIAKRLGL